MVNKKSNHFVDYLFTSTDDTGILQHGKYGVPDRNHGYATDDNARALILAVQLYEVYAKKKYLKLINIYLSFLNHALNDNGMFKNFMGYQRLFLENQGSEDCYGRCLWALCRTLSSHAVPQNMKNTCTCLLKEALKNVTHLSSPRAKAYAIVGISYLEKTEDLNSYMGQLSDSLVVQYQEYRDDSWNWYENSLSYGNAFLPWALSCAHRFLQKKIYYDVAIESFMFLESIVFGEEYFKPIGCNGWLIKGQKQALYDEQPIEACEMLMACLEFYKMTSDIGYLAKAKKCRDWYLGKNSICKSMIDDETGACYDGITEMGINLNQGAESSISYGLAIINAPDFEKKIHA